MIVTPSLVVGDLAVVAFGLVGYGLLHFRLHLFLPFYIASTSGYSPNGRIARSGSDVHSVRPSGQPDSHLAGAIDDQDR